MMTIIKLEKAIKELERKKNVLLIKIQYKGWKDDRPKSKIPEAVEAAISITSLYDTKIIPAKAPLPHDIGRLYQQWYSAARVIIAKNHPNRIDEYDELYLSIKSLLDHKYLTKNEQFRLMDIIKDQFNILASIPSHLKYSMYDIELTAYSILMDDGLNAADHLRSSGYLRPAGLLAGVILERHLKNLLRKHEPPIKFKDNAALALLNDLCKEVVYDQVMWRKIQLLTDLRNICAHDNEREPTKDEVLELIKGVSAVLKSYN